MTQLGWHWIFDAWGVARATIDDVAALERILLVLPARLELTAVSRPQLFEQQGEPRSTAGIVLLAESHLSLHAFPDRGLLHGDLFSCKVFDVPFARRCLEELIGPCRLVDRVLDRGTMRP